MSGSYKNKRKLVIFTKSRFTYDFKWYVKWLIEEQLDLHDALVVTENLPVHANFARVLIERWYYLNL